MKKQLLAGAAALALMIPGAVMAQSVTETTRSTTVTPLPAPAPGYSSTRTETSGFGGATVEKKQHYESGPGGTASSTESKIVRPDGSSESSYKKEWSTGNVPPPAPTLPYGSSSTTTTTTIGR